MRFMNGRQVYHMSIPAEEQSRQQKNNSEKREQAVM